MPALDRALPLAEVDRGAMPVAEDLDLDVPRRDEVLLEIDRAVPERLGRFVGGGGQLGLEIPLVVDDPHPPAAAARGRLQDHRVADLRRQPAGRAQVRERSLAAREHRHAAPLGGLPGGGLVAHQPDRLRPRSDPAEVALPEHLGELRVLGEETVAGVDRVRAGDLRRRDQRRDVEVALRRGGRADADVLVGVGDVERVAVGGRVDRHGRNPQLAAGVDDPQRDLAAVGDQDLAEHRPAQVSRSPKSGSPNSTGWALRG
ncbi:MAG: hypothetical protein BWX64_02454 [Acidobacteria bacterium ADurb.Bin051]|nr:MAG: hypothetical protein BWX64_02454 [Acidobacteria bacterium ADurb.Bin051]